MALAVVAGVVLARRGMLPTPTPAGPPSSRTHVEIPVATELTPPDPAWLLSQHQALKMSPHQVTRLTALKTRWDRDTAPIREALQQATTNFESSMRREADRAASPLVLRQRAAPVSQLTGQLLAVRRTWWREAAKTLNDGQAQEVERRWRARFSHAVQEKPR